MAQFNGSQARYDEGTGKFTFDNPDAVSVGGSPVPQRVMIQRAFNASSVDDWAFIADRAYTVVSIKEIHSVAGNDASAVTLAVRKVTDVSAPGAAAGSTVKELLSSTFNLKATANTVVTGSLTATTADLDLAAGDKIGLDLGGTLTTLGTIHRLAVICKDYYVNRTIDDLFVFAGAARHWWIKPAQASGSEAIPTIMRHQRKPTTEH